MLSLPDSLETCLIGQFMVYVWPRGLHLTYGPAMLVSVKETHPCREFVMVMPCCSSDVWQLRCLVEHDSTACASSVDDCIRGTVAVVRNVGLSPPNAGARLIGQSMGACMALELVKVMFENTAAEAALARRLMSACVVLIGRNDSICSSEECASLALEMRDLTPNAVSHLTVVQCSEVGNNLRSGTIHASHGFLPVVPRPADERVPAPLFVCSAVDLDITGSFDDDV